MSSPAPPPSLHEQAAGQAPPALKAAWLMGRDPVLRQQVWGVLFSSATYLLYGLITVVQVQFGFLSSRQAWILFAGSVVLNAVFYALVRSGWSARTADPGLARTQLLLGVGVMFIAYPFFKGNKQARTPRAATRWRSSNACSARWLTRRAQPCAQRTSRPRSNNVRQAAGACPAHRGFKGNKQQLPSKPCAAGP
jgi:hypothetical protein